MVTQFSSRIGGKFINPTLNLNVKSNPKYIAYHNSTFEEVYVAAGVTSISDLESFPTVTLDRLAFPTFENDFYEPTADAVNGLVIAIHQMWATKVEFKDIALSESGGRGKIIYTLYDHFGLDAADKAKFGGYPVVGDGFKAWYILQHYRNAKPLLIEIEYPIEFIFGD